MNRAFQIVAVSLLAYCGLPISYAKSERDIEIVIITKNGIESAPKNKGRFPKNCDGTLFLRSAVEPTAKEISKKAAKPHASATPRPTPNSSPLTPQLKSKHLPSSAPPPPSRSEAEITIQKKSRTAQPIDDDLDEYSNVATIPDPAEPLNRGTFWINHQLYTFLLRPASKTYEFVLPSPVRQAIHNVFDNAEYPVRAVNHVLQGQFKRADLETRKFAVNTLAGVGGILRVSDRIPDLANVPPADTGQTFAKWGIGHGAYVVLPVLGPRSVRDTVGMAGDYALNPVSWLTYGGVGGAAALAVSAPSAARNLNEKMNLYDTATRNAIDPYIAVRTGYTQYREQSASK